MLSVKERQDFVKTIIEPIGVHDENILKAFAKVPREKFVLPEYQEQAYEDVALPIDAGQTISQPSLVAIMTNLLELKAEEKVLEIGTGSGYQAAILSLLCKEVYTVETIETLATKASILLRKLGYNNVFVFNTDGTAGLPTQAPFDAIIITAAAEKIPEKLVDQLKINGRMVLPVKNLYSQRLKLVKKNPDMIEIHDIEEVSFVPLIGKY